MVCEVTAAVLLHTRPCLFHRRLAFKHVGQNVNPSESFQANWVNKVPFQSAFRVRSPAVAIDRCDRWRTDTIKGGLFINTGHSNHLLRAACWRKPRPKTEFWNNRWARIVQTLPGKCLFYVKQERCEMPWKGYQTSFWVRSNYRPRFGDNCIGIRLRSFPDALCRQFWPCCF